ncbi:CDP-glycerol glycerophosphotransferase family protein [Microlunatus antarcticus]|uniref:CDP-glycerol glycerophosphotransferase (TagB/SpsB family) n=1 Tax=Microlunatus antarcticus TaxID=53388 RepID=A0A7W5P8T1_9ACTN|nr:CDP-glycerol glycerophosphotransferase (TagB/SpsB family) [Microlunatus antarcticus]
MRRPRFDPVKARQRARQRLRERILVVSRSHNPYVAGSFRQARLAARAVGSRVTGRQLGWVAHLRTAVWTGPATFEIGGWAYERGYGHPDGPPETHVWLERGPRRIDAVVTHGYDPEVNAAAPTGSEHDYGNTAFTASFDLTPLLLAPAGDDEPWVAHVRVVGSGRDRTGTFVSRYRLGSVRHLVASTQPDGDQLLARWAGSARGLTLRRRHPAALATSVTLDGRDVSLLVATDGRELAGGSLETDGESTPLTCTPQGRDDAGRPLFRLSGTVPSTAPVVTDRESPLSVERDVHVRTADGTDLAVATDLDDTPPALVEGSSLLLATGGDGLLSLVDAPGRVLVDAVTVSERPPGLRLQGRYVLGELAAAEEAPTLVFSGARQLLPVETTFTPTSPGQGTWEGWAPLLASVWDRQPLPPRTGGYVLRARTPSGTILPVSAVPAITRRTPEIHHLEGFRLRLQAGGGRSMRFNVAAARRDDEVGSFQQRRLERLYRRHTWSPRNAIYLESFYGRGATCNPYAIDREIAARYPQLTRFWGVTDASIPVPLGAITVVRGTREWWHARATSRYVVANDWLRRTFTPQPFQVVLQTWHGSMLKRIGLDRSGQPKSKIDTIRLEQSKWDVLLSQNHHSSVILESAYDWHRTLFEEGYPRNDPLTPGSPYAGDGAAIRERLGIRPDQKAVLYAPTWRENQTSMVTFLDLERLSADLGDGYVILLRGHSRTVKFGASLHEIPGVIDVTTYPEVTDLFLAADAMITDYSSVMFDYSVTRRPMIFYVPDMDDYRDSLRGVYFDLSEVAPGPVLFTQDDVTTAVRELDQAGERYATLYDAWVERFNHHDDGRSAERVVKRLLAIRK